MVGLTFEYSGLDDAISLVGAGIVLGLCGLTIYKSRRSDSKRHYLNRQSVDRRRGEQIGFEFDKKGDIRYFVTRPQL